MEAKIPIPHAEAQHDDGLPWEEALSECSTTSVISDSDEDSLMVPHGNSLSKGLTPLEHVHLSVLASQRPRALKIPEQMLLNIKALFHLSPENMDTDQATHASVIDDFRGKVVKGWFDEVKRLHRKTAAWAAKAPYRIAEPVGQWNGPFIAHLIKVSGHKDPSLVHDLLNGFPMIGTLPKQNQLNG